jgi:nucleoside-diphosphate-sugar epimerase
MRTLIVTGATGFVGREIVARAERTGRWRVIGLSRATGFDLAAPEAGEQLRRLDIGDPAETVLIHSAARIEYDSQAAVIANAAMAVSTAQWARELGIVHQVLVSSVAVLPILNPADRRQPATLYGVGKAAAEHSWRVLLPPSSLAVVRLAGVWGWQDPPGMFWNRLLLQAVRGSATVPVINRRHSRRNYLSVHDAARVLLHVADARLHGVYLAAGRDTLDNAQFVEALQRLPDSRLTVEWRDDGGHDEVLYDCSPEVSALLASFAEQLVALWSERPEGDR